jgi:hypothetical protein
MGTQKGVVVARKRCTAEQIIGQKTELLGLELEVSRKLMFSSFLVDEGRAPNITYLDSWDY